MSAGTQDEVDARAEAAATQGYADSYISDYVTKLEDFIDSYRVDFPFQDGHDTVVVSLRDELLGVRELDCEVEGANLLLESSAPASGSTAWSFASVVTFAA